MAINRHLRHRSNLPGVPLVAWWTLLALGCGAGNNEPTTPRELSTAIWNHDIPALKAMLAKNPALANARSGPFKTPILLDATRRAKGQTEVVALLLDHGADPNGRQEGELGAAALTEAAGDPGSLPVVTLLLDRGANVNLRDAKGRTPLMTAAGSGGPKMVTLLLDRGATVNAEDDAGETAIDKAAVRVKTIEKMGQDPEKVEQVMPILERHGGKPGSRIPKLLP